jgi:hypothetical protein
MALIGANGIYTPVTNGKKGVPPGRYKLSLSTLVVPGASALNPKYANPATSGLAYDVVANPAPGAYDLELAI